MRFLGPHACEEALGRGELHVLRMAPTVWGRFANLREAARSAGVVVHQEPMESLDRRAEGARHQGVLGEGAALRLQEMPDLLDRVRERGNSALVLVLDGITDPHNLGAILRSAAGAAVDGIVFPERRSAQVSDTVVRASAGTAGRVPLVRVVNLGRWMTLRKRASGSMGWRPDPEAGTTGSNPSAVPPHWCWVPREKGCTRRFPNAAISCWKSRCPGASRA